PVYNQTTIVNNYIVNNNRIENRGIPVDRFSSAHRGPIPRATVREWNDRPDRMPTRAGSVVYRPQLNAPARTSSMVAQRVDAQHPTIRHTPSAPPARGQAFAGGNRTRPEPSRPITGTSGTPPSSASRFQSTPASATPAATPPANRGRTTSDWTSRPRASSAPSTPSTSGAAPATPSGPASRTGLTSSSARPSAPTPAQPSTGTSRTTPSASGTRSTTTSTWTSSARPTPAPVAQAAPSASTTVPRIPAGPPAPRAPEEWKQGVRPSPGYRSDAGLPSLYNTRPAAPASAGNSRPATPHFDQPKTQQQAAGVRSLPSTRNYSPAGSASRPFRSPSGSRSGR
ncbi:MAG: hypothetical protein KA117_07340, partial [Verrucomicrobia bacterium]|nr:hypothetical protein [Verrucomicrobiota bacterium]